MSDDQSSELPVQTARPFSFDHSLAVGGTPLIGGRGRVWGTVCGALIMQLVSMTVNMNGMLSSWGMVAKAIILIVAVYIGSDKSKA